MKLAICAVLVVFAVASASANLKCSTKPFAIPTEWLDIKDGCVKEMRKQIRMEITASMQYLAMGAHFSKDTVNRPGFAKFFFDSASEEREHAIKLIEYLLMRGQLTDSVSDLFSLKAAPKITWETGVESLKDALRTEAEVTKSIRQVIASCENSSAFNDYHLVDYLTGVYLEEQYHGQQALATKISTLGKMMESQGALAEFLFDKSM